MMEFFWGIITDIILYGGEGIFFYRLLAPLLKTGNEGRRPKWAEILIVVLPYFVLRMIVTRSMWVQRLFYGEQLYITDSKDTIIVVFSSFLVLLGSGITLFRKKKSQVLYLATVYMAISELVRFGMYCLTVWMPEIAFDVINRSLLETGTMNVDQHYMAVEVIQIVWNLIFWGGYLLGILWVTGRYRSYLLWAEELPRGQEIVYLMIPALTSICFSILLRSILVSVEDGQAYLIFDKNKALYGVIPCIAFLCILLMLASVKNRWQMLKKEQEKARLMIYQNQVEDMENHIRDLERMQDGIRGMKHDMRNYMADIQALLRLEQVEETMAFSKENGEKPEVRQELKRYFTGMEQTLSECSVSYQTGNTVTDVIMTRYFREARQKKIKLECCFTFPKGNIDPFDLSIILNNGWNNAVEACQKLDAETRWISIKSVQQGQTFFLEIKNSMSGILKRKEGVALPETTKSDSIRHGFGLKNIESIVKKYQGHMECEEKEGVFCLTVLFPILDL